MLDKIDNIFGKFFGLTNKSPALKPLGYLVAYGIFLPFVAIAMLKEKYEREGS